VVINGAVYQGNGIIVAGDQQARMGEIMVQLNRDNEAQIRMQQEQIAKQLSEIGDNRAQRLFQRRAAGSQQVALPQAAPADAFGLSEGTEVAVQKDKKWSGTDDDEVYEAESEKAGRVVTLSSGAVDAGGIAAHYKLDEAGVAVLSARGGDGWAERGGPVQVYVAKGTYSLPVSLPEGGVRLDFARPGADAKLTLWAVPTRLLQALYGTVGVIVAALVLLGLIRIWPDSVISVKRMVVYIVLFVVLAVLLGLLGVIISIPGILIIEAVRGSWRRPAEAAA
jgi:hypothetical protein